MHPPSKNAYPLTTEQFLLEIDIFAGKSGKQDAYHGMHNGYHEVPPFTAVSSTVTNRNIYLYCGKHARWHPNESRLPGTKMVRGYHRRPWEGKPDFVVPRHRGAPPLKKRLPAYPKSFSIENLNIYL